MLVVRIPWGEEVQVVGELRRRQTVWGKSSRALIQVSAVSVLHLLFFCCCQSPKWASRVRPDRQTLNPKRWKKGNYSEPRAMAKLWTKAIWPSRRTTSWGSSNTKLKGVKAPDRIFFFWFIWFAFNYQRARHPKRVGYIRPSEDNPQDLTEAERKSSSSLHFILSRLVVEMLTSL